MIRQNRRIRVLSLALLLGSVSTAQADSAPATSHLVLESKALAVTWRLSGRQLVPNKIDNKLSAQTLPQESAALFRVTLEDAGGGRRILAASDLEPVADPGFMEIEARRDAIRAAERVAGRALRATFRDGRSGTTIRWRAVLREGGAYVRTFITLEGGKLPVRLRHVELLDVRGPASRQVGTVPGSPVVIGQTFFGVELPFAVNRLRDGEFHGGLECNLPLGPADSCTFSAVIGATARGQLRRGFLHYLENERAVPYHPFLHYNCWYDLGRRVNEKEMLAAIGAFSREMTEKRGAVMDSYVLDDGWDDPKEGFWAVDKTKFPGGFESLRPALEKADSHLGIWISPLGGYAWASRRVEQARRLGLVDGPQLDLSDARYYAWFRDYCAALMRKDRVNYFKWDKAGRGVSPHFMALLACAGELRRIDPRLFINVTAGTWPSPFWLLSIDSTWREGTDMSWQGKGDDREQWITYRDARTCTTLTHQGPLYPLNSLMVIGVVHARGHVWAARASQAGGDLRHEARSYFGMGTNLQELYIQHDMMDAAAWDAVAGAAKWARQNADVLVDTHWIGGDPGKLEPYGFASWSPRKAVLALRNPDDKPREIALDAGVVFELPEGAAGRYTLTGVYEDLRVKTLTIEQGKKTVLRLDPFEVLVFDASPADPISRAAIDKPKTKRN